MFSSRQAHLFPFGARSRRRVPALAICALLLALLAAACSSDDTASSSDDSAVESPAMAGDQMEGAEVGFADGEDTAAAGESADAATEVAAVAPGDADIAPLPDTATTGERVIKEGTLTIEVEPGEFDAAFGQVISRVQALGGHVAGTSSSTSQDADGNPLVSGQVTVRVPVRTFEDLLTSIGEAGTITDRNVTSQDVTAEYTDLESRRRNLQAQERFYLGLLDRAASVSDAIAVQQQLDGIQGQIEQITGRLNLLQDRTAFSTLTVRINEQGADGTIPLDETEPTGLAPYISDAVDTLVATTGSLIVFITFIIPFALLALVGYAIWRRVRGRRPASPAPATHPYPQPHPQQQPVSVGGPASPPVPAEGDTDN